MPPIDGDWPGLAPAGESLSCGDKQVTKEAPPAAPPATPVPSLRPRPAGRVETRPSGSDSDATIPAGHGLHSAAQKGKGSPARRGQDVEAVRVSECNVIKRGI